MKNHASFLLCSFILPTTSFSVNNKARIIWAHSNFQNIAKLESFTFGVNDNPHSAIPSQSGGTVSDQSV